MPRKRRGGCLGLVAYGGVAYLGYRLIAANFVLDTPVIGTERYWEEKNCDKREIVVDIPNTRVEAEETDVGCYLTGFVLGKHDPFPPQENLEIWSEISGMGESE